MLAEKVFDYNAVWESHICIQVAKNEQLKMGASFWAFIKPALCALFKKKSS